MLEKNIACFRARNSTPTTGHTSLVGKNINTVHVLALVLIANVPIYARSPFGPVCTVRAFEPAEIYLSPCRKSTLCVLNQKVIVFCTSAPVRIHISSAW